MSIYQSIIKFWGGHKDQFDKDFRMED